MSDAAALSVTLPGLPPTVNHQYAGRWQGGRRLTPEAAAWRDGATLAIRASMAPAGRLLRTTPWAVALHLEAPDCYRWDLDNRCKSALDALAAALGLDDRYITALHVTKARGPVGQTTIRVEVFNKL